MKPDKRKRVNDCIDEMNRHRANAGVLAGLLEYCDAESIDGGLVVEAGGMICDELDEVQAWTHRLAKELRR